jgi:hypothetical protein
MRRLLDLSKNLFAVISVVVLVAVSAFLFSGQRPNTEITQPVSVSATPARTATVQAAYPLPATPTQLTNPISTQSANLASTATPSRQAAYPLPQTPTPDLTPRPTIIKVLTPPASLVPPPPPGTSRPTPLSASEELRQTLMRFPLEKRTVVDQDAIAVILLKGDPHNITETRERLVLVVHHVPSLSVVGLDLTRYVDTNYRSSDGQRYFESMLSNQALMNRLYNFLDAYASKLPQ